MNICSFCHLKQNEVIFLLAGMDDGVQICDRCIVSSLQVVFADTKRLMDLMKEAEKRARESQSND